MNSSPYFTKRDTSEIVKIDGSYHLTAAYVKKGVQKTVLANSVLGFMSSLISFSFAISRCITLSFNPINEQQHFGNCITQDWPH